MQSRVQEVQSIDNHGLRLLAVHGSRRNSDNSATWYAADETPGNSAANSDSSMTELLQSSFSLDCTSCSPECRGAVQLFSGLHEVQSRVQEVQSSM